VPDGAELLKSLDRFTQQAHWDWLRRGKTGEGRIDVAGLDAARGRYDGFKAAGARFERVDFRDSNFNLADWSEVELIGCNLDISSINSTWFIEARILGSTFEGCGGALVHFGRANIYGSSFARSNLDGARFEGAAVASTSFEGVRFGNVHWDRATFQGCSFRGASLEPTRRQPTPTMRGTRFEQCDFRDADFTGADLRDAAFSGCQFAGAHGIPTRTLGVTITGADTEDLLAQLTRMLSPGEVLTLKKPVVAEDLMPGASSLAVFELVGSRARLIGKTDATGVETFRTAGITVGTTYGTTGFLWAHTPETFRVWCSEGMPLEVTRQELRMSTVPSPVTDVKSVALLRDPDQRGRRGVVVRTPEAKPVRLVVVQDDDWAASDDASYSDAEVRRDAGWAPLLAAELASWLGVPFDG
jgi:uncharacterized protein YjbI with pentapeptide repeats